MAHRNNDSKLDNVMELLIENGFEGFIEVLRILLNEAMKIERVQAVSTTFQGCLLRLPCQTKKRSLSVQRFILL